MGENETILIVNRKRGKDTIKITKQMRGNFRPPESFTQIVNLKNYKNLALFLHDLGTLWSAPIDKAIAQYKEDKNTGWPF